MKILDTDKIREQFQQLRRRHPQHKKDIARFEHTVEGLISQYHSHLVMHRQTHRAHYLRAAEAAVKEIETVLNQIARCELFVLLSRS